MTKGLITRCSEGPLDGMALPDYLWCIVVSGDTLRIAGRSQDVAWDFPVQRMVEFRPGEAQVKHTYRRQEESMGYGTVLFFARWIRARERTMDTQGPLNWINHGFSNISHCFEVAKRMCWWRSVIKSSPGRDSRSPHLGFRRLLFIFHKFTKTWQWYASLTGI